MCKSRLSFLAPALAGLLFFGCLATLPAAHAGKPLFKVGQRLRAADIKAAPGFFPLLVLATPSIKDTPIMRIYGTLKDAVYKDRSFKMYERLYVLKDWRDGDIDVFYVFEVSELYRKQVLFEVKDAPIVGDEEVLSIRWKRWNETGFDLEMTILRDATNIVRAKRVTRTLSIVIENEPTVRYDGKEIYKANIYPRTQVGQMVGVDRLEFYAPDTTYVSTTKL